MSEYVTEEEAQNQRKNHLRALIIIIVVVLIGFILFLKLNHYTSDGKIIITTNDSSAAITLVKSNTDDSAPINPAVNLSNGVLTSMAPGTYLALVQGTQSSASKTVLIKPHSTSTYNINVGSVSTPELIANVNSRMFSVGSNDLYYIDQGTNGLYSIDTQNNLSALNISIAFKTVHWADSSFGVAQDSAGALYEINNGVVSNLSVPAGLNSSSTEFAVAPNHDIYLASGKKIYQGTVSGFQQIFTADITPSYMISSNSRVALIYNPGDGDTKSKPTTIILQGSTKIAESNVEAYESSWSPSGKYLVTTTDDISQIYNNALQPVAVVPNNNVNNPVWINDNTIVYGVSNDLWEYSLSGSEGNVVSSSASGHSISDIVISPDNSYAYLSVQATSGSNDDLVIERVGLNGQPTSTVVSKVQNSFPWLAGRCLLSLVSFGSTPTIESYGGHPEDNCPAQAQSYISQLGGNPNQFTYLDTAVAPDEPATL